MSDETRDPAGEEKVGELLKRHARLYHDPPAAPREVSSRVERVK